MENSNRVRVLWCAYDWENHVSGPGTWLANLLRDLKGRGIESVVDVLYWDRPGPLTTALRDAEIETVVNPAVGPTQDRIRGILERVRDFKPDIFVPNLVLPALFASRWVRESGVPTVAVLHSDDAFYRGVIDVFVSGRQLERIDNVVTVSQCLTELASERCTSATSLWHIPYGVCVPDQKIETSADEVLSIVYSGRLVEEQKQVHSVVSAMLRCVTEVPNCTAVLIGDGPERTSIAERLMVEPGGSAVELAGRLPAADVQQKISESDIFLLLSDYEGLPIALLEAMACGLVPIVNRMRSGIPELVQHMQNGIIVENRSDAVVSAVRLLQENLELRKCLSKTARQTVREKYSKELCTARWEELLQRLATQGPSKTTELQIPSVMHLPPVHPALAAEDPRATAPTVIEKLLTNGRRFINRVLRQVEQ